MLQIGKLEDGMSQSDMVKFLNRTLGYITEYINDTGEDSSDSKSVEESVDYHPLCGKTSLQMRAKYVKMVPMAASSAPVNSYFIDSSNGKASFKDSTGTVTALY